MFAKAAEEIMEKVRPELDAKLNEFNDRADRIEKKLDKILKKLGE